MTTSFSFRGPVNLPVRQFWMLSSESYIGFFFFLAAWAPFMHTCYLAPRCWQYCVSDSKWGLQQGSDLAVQQRFDDKDPSFPLGILLKASHRLLLAFFPWCILVSCFPQASRTHRPPSSLRSRALVNLPEPATGSPAFPLLTDTAYQQHPTTAALVEVPQFSSCQTLCNPSVCRFFLLLISTGWDDGSILADQTAADK